MEEILKAMQDTLDALKELDAELSRLVESQTKVNVNFATRLHALEVSLQTGANYPIENATKDLEGKNEMPTMS